MSCSFFTSASRRLFSLRYELMAALPSLTYWTLYKQYSYMYIIYTCIYRGNCNSWHQWQRLWGWGSEECLSPRTLPRWAWENLIINFPFLHEVLFGAPSSSKLTGDIETAKTLLYIVKSTVKRYREGAKDN